MAGNRTPTKTILLVEDEPLIAMAEKMTLERNGYMVITAGSGEKAIVAVREHQEIDLILMDIDLGGGIRGTEAAEVILNERDLPLVFLSSHTEQAVVDETEGITSYGYIVKNSGNTVLLASIRMAFRLYDAHLELVQRKEHLDNALAREEHANEQLQEKTEELERYFSTSLDMLCIANTDGEFLRLNPEWEKVLGYPLRELEGKQFIGFVHPEDRDATLNTLARLEQQNEVLSFENRYRCSDGSYRWIEWRSRPEGTRIYAAARDITDRRNAEEAHRASEAIFRNLMENSIDAVQLLDEDGRFLDINNVACEMTGYTREELLAMRIADIDPNYPDEGFSEFWRKQPKGTSILFETIHRHKNGRLIPVEVNGIFFELNDRKLLFGVARDITDRRNAEVQLREQAALQHLLMTIATELIDVPLDEVDDRINWVLAEMGRFNDFDRVFLFYNDFDLHVSTNTHEWCGLGITSEMENLQALPFHEISRIMDAHRRGEAFVLPHVAALPEDDSIRALMEKQDIKSTLLLPLMHEGVNIGFIGFDSVREERSVSKSIVDLLRFTARLIVNIESRRAGDEKQRAAERAIRENEERFRGLLDGIREVPVQGFGRDGTVHYWNLASEALYGYRAQEAIGRNVLDLLIPAELQPAIRERIARMSSSGEPYPATEDWIARKDGSRVLIRTTHAVVQLPDRDMEIFSVDQDVTERRQAEEDVRRLVREKEMLLKEVQHRIKNTMNTMGSLLSLHAHNAGEPAAATALNDARSRFRSMEVLYDQLYRTDTHTGGSVRQYLTQLVEPAIDLFPGGDAVRTILEMEDIVLDTRRLSALGMIVNELITNTMKYAFRDHPEPRLTLTGYFRGEGYALVVADNGPGLPEDFDQEASTSFGMAMVNALATQLKGTVRFEPGEGTTAVLEFPVGDGREDRQSREDRRS